MARTHKASQKHVPSSLACTTELRVKAKAKAERCQAE